MNLIKKGEEWCESADVYLVFSCTCNTVYFCWILTLGPVHLSPWQPTISCCPPIRSSDLWRQRSELPQRMNTESTKESPRSNIASTFAVFEETLAQVRSICIWDLIVSVPDHCLSFYYVSISVIMHLVYPLAITSVSHSICE